MKGMVGEKGILPERSEWFSFKPVYVPFVDQLVRRRLVHLIPLKTTRSPYVGAMVQKGHTAAGTRAPLNMACESCYSQTKE